MLRTQNMIWKQKNLFRTTDTLLKPRLIPQEQFLHCTFCDRFWLRDLYETERIDLYYDRIDHDMITSVCSSVAPFICFSFSGKDWNSFFPCILCAKIHISILFLLINKQ